MSNHYWTGRDSTYREFWRERYDAVKRLLDEVGYVPFNYDDYLVVVAVQYHQYGEALQRWLLQNTDPNHRGPADEPLNLDDYLMPVM